MSKLTRISTLWTAGVLLVASVGTATIAVARSPMTKVVAGATTPLVKTPLKVAVTSFSIKNAVGRWHAPNGSAMFEFQIDGTIIDNLHSAHGKSSGKTMRGSNLAVTYPGNRACYYTALLQKDGKKLFLAEKPPKTPNWTCFTGVLVKSS